MAFPLFKNNKTKKTRIKSGLKRIKSIKEMNISKKRLTNRYIFCVWRYLIKKTFRPLNFNQR